MSNSDQQKWYVATLIMRCEVPDKLPPHTCDEQIRLLRAADADAAYQKALSLGKNEEETYQNIYGAEVHWEFVGYRSGGVV